MVFSDVLQCEGLKRNEIFIPFMFSDVITLGNGKLFLILFP